MGWPPVRCGWRPPGGGGGVLADREGVNLYGTVKVGGTEIGDYVRAVVYQVLSEMVKS